MALSLNTIDSRVRIAPGIRPFHHQKTGTSPSSKVTRSVWLKYSLPPTPDQMLHQRTPMRNDGTEPMYVRYRVLTARSRLTSCLPTGMTSVTTRPAFAPVAAHMCPSLWFTCWRSAPTFATLLGAHLLSEHLYMVPSFQPQRA